MDEIKILKAIETCIEMLIERGYYTSHENDGIVIFESSKDKVCIFVNRTSKLILENLEIYLYQTKSLGLSHCIILYNGFITPKAKSIIQTQNKIIPTRNSSLCEPEHKLHCELFTFLEMQYNITKHVLVPKHIRLSKAKSKEFKVKHGTKFPVLLVSDPVSKFYNFEVGDVIKIERRTDDNYPLIIYRIVK